MRNDQPQCFHTGSDHPVVFPSGSNPCQLDPIAPRNRQSCSVAPTALEAGTSSDTVAVTPTTVHRRMKRLQRLPSPEKDSGVQSNPVTHACEIPRVPGPLLFGERNFSCTTRASAEPLLSVAQRVGKESQATVPTKRHACSHEPTDLANFPKAPGTAGSRVRYTRHQEKALPDETVNKPVVTAA
ncbi:unnamed protein product, partial [Sphacelaria rigidula]